MTRGPLAPLLRGAGRRKRTVPTNVYFFCLCESPPKITVAEQMATNSERSYLPRWLRVIVVGRNPKWTLVRIVVFVAVVFLLREFVLLPIRVQGPSMLPT